MLHKLKQSRLTAALSWFQRSRQPAPHRLCSTPPPLSPLAAGGAARALLGRQATCSTGALCRVRKGTATPAAGAQRLQMSAASSQLTGLITLPEVPLYVNLVVEVDVAWKHIHWREEGGPVGSVKLQQKVVHRLTFDGVQHRHSAVSAAQRQHILLVWMPRHHCHRVRNALQPASRQFTAIIMHLLMLHGSS
jgi:hypothetical protein